MNRKGQVWIETVIYTLIGLALIGLVLAILTPKIKEFRDRSVIEQTMESLNTFDSKIVDTLDAPGNKRKITFKLDRGVIIINTLKDRIEYILEESNVRYSEPNLELQLGRVNVTTEEMTDSYKITLYIPYNYNLTYDGKDGSVETFTPVSIPYDFFIENRGIVNGKPWIDITEGS
jgi:type II secretory pathway pseudopilin PulG